VVKLRLGRDRPRETEAQPSAPPAPESPAELRRGLVQINRFINQSAGRLPVRVVVNARYLTDTLSEIVDTSDVRPLDIYAAISVAATVNDYLPTTLRNYLAIDEAHLNTPHNGHLPVDSLVEQLDALRSSAELLLVAARDQDVDALLTQGNFLRTKFTGSDLDI
jgi:hypothetical protein